jgi:hypothetical protein
MIIEKATVSDVEELLALQSFPRVIKARKISGFIKSVAI